MAINPDRLCAGESSLTDEEVLDYVERKIDVQLICATSPIKFIIPDVIVRRKLEQRLVNRYRQAGFGDNIRWWRHESEGYISGLDSTYLDIDFDFFDERARKMRKKRWVEQKQRKLEDHDENR